MKPQDIALALALIAALPIQSTLEERRAASGQFDAAPVVSEIDFIDLHRQAVEALASLQQSGHNRLAMVAEPTR
jgi:hypothetical protein